MVDHVDVADHARLERAPVAEAVQAGGVVGLLLHDPLERQALAPGAVAGPVGEHERGLRGVADHAAVRATVGEAEGRPRVQQHLAGRLEAADRSS